MIRNLKACVPWLFAAIGVLQASAAFADEYRDIGSAGDFDSSANIYFEKEGGLGGESWPKYWNLAETGTDGVISEDGENIYWATKAPDPARAVSARVVKFHQFGRFRVKAASFSDDGERVLTVRYKDDLPAPAPIFGWNGSKWQPIGELGGKADHRWKSEQLKIPAGVLEADQGAYGFRIGAGSYNDSLKGEFAVDRIKLGMTADKSEFPPDADGLWPAMPANKFASLGDNMVFGPGEKPFFPLGVYGTEGFYVSDGGTATSAGHGAMDTWQIMQDAGLNCYVIHGWEQNWDSRWDVYPDERPSQYAAPGMMVKAGLYEHLLQAAAHGLKVIPNMLTDTRGYWIANMDGSEQKMRDRLNNVMKQFDGNPALLAWYPVDEWDHEDSNFGKPHGFSHMLYRDVRQYSPNRPGFILSMGFHGPDVWRATEPEADIFGVDVYPTDSKDIVKGLATQAKRLDEMRSVLGRKKPYVLVPELYQEESMVFTPQEIVAQAYMGLIHGARGLLFFKGVHPAKPEAPKDIWVGIKQVSNELFGPEGLAQALLPGDAVLDMMGEQGMVKVSSDDVHTLLVKDASGKRILLALNASKAPISGVRFTIKDTAGKAFTRFENGRAVAIDGGVLRDDFQPLERHVYTLDN